MHDAHSYPHIPCMQFILALQAQLTHSSSYTIQQFAEIDKTENDKYSGVTNSNGHR